MSAIKWIGILTTGFILAGPGCKKSPAAAQTTRTYRMGFQNSAPKADYNIYIQSLQMWTQRADAAIINTEVPWDSLVGGEDPALFVNWNYKGLADYYRSLHYQLWVYIDIADGLNRATDAAQLVGLGRSIAQPDMQQVYRRFCFVMDSILAPDHLGLALETNLIRGSSPDSIYQGIKKATNAAATQIRSSDPKVKMGVSVQADWAWGILGSGVYQGVAQDFTDFPFIQELGISSYPYLNGNGTAPAAIPLNYYSKLVEGRNTPVFVSEGGWTSRNLPVSPTLTIQSNPSVQADYIRRQGQLLDQAHAIAYFQLTFTDIDLSALPPSVPSTIDYFAYLGLVDSVFQPKPALATWDSLYKRPLVP
jgi:hypothetical protein